MLALLLCLLLAVANADVTLKGGDWVHLTDGWTGTGVAEFVSNEDGISGEFTVSWQKDAAVPVIDQGKVIIAHLHDVPCAEGGGGHWKENYDISAAEKGNEVWLGGATTDVDGDIKFTVDTPVRELNGKAISIVIHYGEDKVLCTDLSFHFAPTVDSIKAAEGWALDAAYAGKFELAYPELHLDLKTAVGATADGDLIASLHPGKCDDVGTAIIDTSEAAVANGANGSFELLDNEFVASNDQFLTAHSLVVADNAGWKWCTNLWEVAPAETPAPTPAPVTGSEPTASPTAGSEGEEESSANAVLFSATIAIATVLAFF